MNISIVKKIIIVFLIVTITSTVLIIYLFIREEDRAKELLVENNIVRLAEEKAQVINLIFNSIENETANLAYAVRCLLESEVSPEKLDDIENKYKRDLRGVLGRVDSTDGSNVFLSNDIKLNDKIKRDIYLTEKLDPLFKKIKTKNPEVEWAYLTTKDNMLRLYPYLSNDIFGADHKHYNDPFFTIADELNNPERKVVWSSPYYDYAGKGWLLTCSSPVYVNDSLEMVVSLDITLESIKNLIADFKLARTGFAFLIDKNGNVIYHPHHIPAFSKSGNLLAQNLITQSSEKAYRDVIKKLLASDSSIFEYKDGSGQAFLISGVKINNDWLLGIQVNKKDYMLNFMNLFPAFTMTALIIIFTAIVLGTYLFYRISIPISQLAKEAREIASGNYRKISGMEYNDEIGELSRAFNEMSRMIRERTRNLENSKKQLETIFNSISELFFICNSDYSLVIVNRKGRELCEDLDEAIKKGKKCHEVFRNLSSPCPNCPVEDVVKNKVSIKNKVVVGQKVYSVDVTPVFNSDGEVDRVIVYSVDITRSEIMDKVISHREKLAKLGQMAGGIIHELKNPMSVMKGTVYLLNKILESKRLTKQDLEDVVFAVREIEKSVDYSQRVISNVLEFTRKSSREKEEIPLKPVFEHILLILNQKIIDQNIEVDINVMENISVYINLDSLKHILINVVSNSIEAMPEGGRLKITASMTDDNKWVEINVSDTGCGIDESDLDKIFDPYFTLKEKGTGLGLWITKSEVESAGGKITVKSRPGEYTVFTIVLPANG